MLIDYFMDIDIFNFDIKTKGPISIEFLNRDIHTFQDAADFIRKLPYGRNIDKNNLLSVFIDNRGTCSTKHALLKVLADENGLRNIKLMLGIFKMSGFNTPRISKTLLNHNLQYIPEAHNYLKIESQILDYTKLNSRPSNFENELIEEIEIAPDQIADFKVMYHTEFLKRWLEQNPDIPFTIDELWQIREQCISDLSNREK